MENIVKKGMMNESVLTISQTYHAGLLKSFFQKLFNSTMKKKDDPKSDFLSHKMSLFCYVTLVDFLQVHAENLQRASKFI